MFHILKVPNASMYERCRLALGWPENKLSQADKAVPHPVSYTMCDTDSPC